MRSDMTMQLGFVNTDQKPYRKQCRTSRHHDKNKNHQPADVLLSGARTQFLDRRRQNGEPREEKHTKDEGVPSRDRFGGSMHVTAQRKSDSGCGKKRDDQQMESGKLPLEDLIVRYEEGMNLVKICQERLASAEQKIEMIARNSAGKAIVKDFEATQEPAASANVINETENENDEIKLF